MPNPFAVVKSQQGEIAIIKLEGYVDAHTSPQFEAAVQAEVDASHFKIIVDCEKLTFIASSGLGVFVSFIEEVREQGGDIKICHIIPKVKQAFDTLGFASIFEIFDDISAALKSFHGEAARKV